MTTFQELQNTPIGWRFTDENYNIIDSRDLKKIKLNKAEESQIKWKKFTGSEEMHLMNLSSAFWNNLVKIDEFELEWGEEESEKNNKLPKINNIKLNDEITFFWGANNSIEADWSIFLKYWDDFCYPSDDNNLIVCKKRNLCMSYIEDFFSIYSLSEISLQK
ncbi:DUF2947 family protein [Flavobacterium aestivum]|uniref:DUF2947 family protein n=1 Tax=Flavobacterium aestivum TaxID=3003257 RepID=UPI0024824FC8|nr:DUF2947 family protein [Flavobacterium aestivum]